VFADVAGDGDEVGAASGEEDAEAQCRGCYRILQACVTSEAKAPFRSGR
jgi:hypothetical protein